jgi:hypothetical protein
MASSAGFGLQSGSSGFASGLGGSTSARNNGLLNALSGNNRAPTDAARVTSPGGFGGNGYVPRLALRC